MHSDIKKFWENVGVVNCIDEPTSHITNVPYYYVNIGVRSKTIAAPFDECGSLAYHLDGRWYTEDVMLRLIKLKLFL